MVPYQYDLSRSSIADAVSVLHYYLHPTESILPRPLSISTDASSGDTIFSFFDNNHTPLSALINNATFHRQLRDHFFVLAAWCRQVAYLNHRLRHSDRSLIHTPRLEDVYITEVSIISLYHMMFL